MEDEEGAQEKEVQVVNADGDTESISKTSRGSSNLEVKEAVSQAFDIIQTQDELKEDMVTRAFDILQTHEALPEDLVTRAFDILQIHEKMKEDILDEIATRGQMHMDFKQELLDMFTAAAIPSPPSSEFPTVVTFRETGYPVDVMTSTEGIDRGEGEPSIASLMSHDGEYLKKHLGRPLVMALADVVSKRPKDPIHFLAHWLYRWKADQERRHAKESFLKELNAERAIVAERLAEEARIEAERRAREEEERQAAERREEVRQIFSEIIYASTHPEEEEEEEQEVKDV